MRAESSPTQWERERKLKKEGQKESAGEVGVTYSKECLELQGQEKCRKERRRERKLWLN